MSKTLAIIRDSANVVRATVGLANAISNLYASHKGYRIAVETLRRAGLKSEDLRPGADVTIRVRYPENADRKTVDFLIAGGFTAIESGLPRSRENLHAAGRALVDAVNMLNSEWRGCAPATLGIILSSLISERPIVGSSRTYSIVRP